MNYKSLCLVLLSIFIFGCLSVKHGNNAGSAGNSTVTIIHDTIDDPDILVTLQSKDSTYLLFRGNFEDTMAVKFNNAKVGQYPIYRKNYPFPTRADDANIEVGLLRKPGKNVVSLMLTGSQQAVQFKLPDGYPVCLIEYYNEKWTIKFRKHMVIMPVTIIRK